MHGIEAPAAVITLTCITHTHVTPTTRRHPIRIRGSYRMSTTQTITHAHTRGETKKTVRHVHRNAENVANQINDFNRFSHQLGARGAQNNTIRALTLANNRKKNTTRQKKSKTFNVCYCGLWFCGTWLPSGFFRLCHCMRVLFSA